MTGLDPASASLSVGDDGAPPTDPVAAAPLWLAWSIAAAGFAALAGSLFLGLTGAVAEPTDALSPSSPYVAIVIDDVGLDTAAARRAIALPAPATLAILPYAEAAAEVDALAAAAGRETIVHLPMEPLGLEDPGPDALTSWLTPEAVRARVEAALGAVPGAVGVSNHMGSRFTACGRCVAPVAEAAAERGLFVLDSLTTGSSELASAARAAGAQSIARDVFLDDDPSFDAVLAQLAAAERVARRDGVAVAIGHPRPATLDALEQWIPQARARGIEIGPVTGALARRSGELVLVGAGL